MFDVYLSGKRDLLVVGKGLSIPAGTSGDGASPRRGLSKSVTKLTVQRLGYYVRKLRDLPIKAN